MVTYATRIRPREGAQGASTRTWGMPTVKGGREEEVRKETQKVGLGRQAGNQESSNSEGKDRVLAESQGGPGSGITEEHHVGPVIRGGWGGQQGQEPACRG